MNAHVSVYFFAHARAYQSGEENESENSKNKLSNDYRLLFHCILQVCTSLSSLNVRMS